MTTSKTDNQEAKNSTASHVRRTLPADLAGLLRQCEAFPPLADITALAVHTGLRLSELAELRPADVNLDARDLHVFRHVRAMDDGERVLHLARIELGDRHGSGLVPETRVMGRLTTAGLALGIDDTDTLAPQQAHGRKTRAREDQVDQAGTE